MAPEEFIQLEPRDHLSLLHDVDHCLDGLAVLGFLAILKHDISTTGHFVTKILYDIFSFGNLATCYEYQLQIFPAQTTWSHREAHKASLPHPPHSDHWVCSERQALSFASLAPPKTSACASLSH